MKLSLTIVFLAALLAPGVAFTQIAANAQDEAAAAAIRHRFQRWVNAFERGDADAVANVYAKDAVVFSQNKAKQVKGRAAIQEILSRRFRLATQLDYDYNIQVLVVNGDWAHRWGTAHITAHLRKPRNGQDTIKSTLKFLDIWRKGPDGVWRIFRDIGLDTSRPSPRETNSCMKPKKSATTPLSVATLKAYVGHYQLEPGKVLNITLKGSQLYIQQNSGSAIAIYTNAKDKFFAKVVDVQLSFQRNDRGNVTALVVHKSGKSARAPRIDN